jgi:hypothetical protein
MIRTQVVVAGVVAEADAVLPEGTRTGLDKSHARALQRPASRRSRGVRGVHCRKVSTKRGAPCNSGEGTRTGLDKSHARALQRPASRRSRGVRGVHWRKVSTKRGAPCNSGARPRRCIGVDRERWIMVFEVRVNSAMARRKWGRSARASTFRAGTRLVRRASTMSGHRDRSPGTPCRR